MIKLFSHHGQRRRIVTGFRVKGCVIFKTLRLGRSWEHLKTSAKLLMMVGRGTAPSNPRQRRSRQFEIYSNLSILVTTVCSKLIVTSNLLEMDTSVHFIVIYLNRKLFSRFGHFLWFWNFENQLLIEDFMDFEKKTLIFQTSIKSSIINRFSKF